MASGGGLVCGLWELIYALLPSAPGLPRPLCGLAMTESRYPSLSAEPTTEPVRTAPARKCTVEGTDKICQGAAVMSRCEHGDNVGFCTASVWHDDAAKCVCASVPAKKVDRGVRKVIKKVMGEPEVETPKGK